MARVYLSGSSAQLQRVRYAAGALYAAGCELVEPWWDGAEFWQGTDARLTIDEQARIAGRQRSAISECHIFWLLASNEPSSSLIEYGYALSGGCSIIVTGFHSSKRLWTALADYRDVSDDLGLVEALRIAKGIDNV